MERRPRGEGSGGCLWTRAPPSPNPNVEVETRIGHVCARAVGGQGAVNLRGMAPPPPPYPAEMSDNRTAGVRENEAPQAAVWADSFCCCRAPGCVWRRWWAVPKKARRILGTW